MTADGTAREKAAWAAPQIHRISVSLDTADGFGSYSDGATSASIKSATNI